MPGNRYRLTKKPSSRTRESALSSDCLLPRPLFKFRGSAPAREQTRDAIKRMAKTSGGEDFRAKLVSRRKNVRYLLCFLAAMANSRTSEQVAPHCVSYRSARDS
jgi:hypothetical protein